ncbi:class I SAM-dependent methyltransferase [Bradyrhizobium sp. LjRoot220]|uniref:class I SAM-dependent methyltransferase n=1 Tax=Bradyrhizobium sp. LjRoot220 TaxID=3342284 RepID=UPI003ECC67DA
MRKPRFIAEQGRQPSGLLGQIVARVMAKETAGENDFALKLLQLQPEDAVLEIGCGHGETLAKCANVVSRGILRGIDFSPVMHRHAMRRHRRLVAEKRIEFHLGSSDQLPFDDETFNRAFAVHTIYFWKTPLDHLAEACRVLNPGGRFVLGFRPAEDPGFRATYPSEIYHIRPEAEVVQLAEDAGFESIDLRRHTRGKARISFLLAQKKEGRQTEAVPVRS